MTDRTQVQPPRAKHHARLLTVSTLLTGFVLARIATAQVPLIDSASKTRVRPEPVLLDHFPCNVGDIPNLSPCANDLYRVPVPTSMKGLDPSDQSYGPIPITVGDWQGFVARDPRTDHRTVVFNLPATNTPVALLTLRCDKGKLDAYIHSEALAAHGHRQAMVRFGTDPPETHPWFTGINDTTAFIAGDQNKVEAFIEKMADYTHLSVQVRDHPAVAFTFDLAGIQFVGPQLESACKR